MKELIISELNKHNILRCSHSWHDYEYCKQIIYPELYRRKEVPYEFFIKIVIEYLEL